jgi:hypothetical protein
MAVLLTRTPETDTHVYLLWKENGEVKYIHCGTARTILRNLNSPLAAAHNDVDATPEQLTEAIDYRIREMDVETVANRLQLQNPPSKQLRGAFRLPVESDDDGQLSLYDCFPNLMGDIITHEDIPETLLINETSVDQIPTPANSTLEQSSNADVRTQCEKEYKKRVVRDRGSDQYTDEVKELYEYQCAVCQLSQSTNRCWWGYIPIRSCSY